MTRVTDDLLWRPRRTRPDPLAAHAARRGDAVALVTPADAWTWRALDAHVDRVAERLRYESAFGFNGWHNGAREARGALGMAEPPASGLAVQAPTSPALVVLALAALRAGMVWVPLSPRWPPDAVAAALARLGIRHLVTDGAAPPGWTRHALADLVAAGETPSDRAAKRPWPFDGTSQFSGLTVLDTERRWDLDAFWTVVHTSGSTGTPKAALHTVGNHTASADGVTERLGLRAGDRWWLDLPLEHVGGLGVVTRCVLAGAAIAMPARERSVADNLAALRPTHASLVPTQLARWLDAVEGGADASSLRAVLVGGAATPPALIDRAVAAGLPVCTSWGMTEMTATVTATPPGAGRAALATSGAPLPGREVRVSRDGEVWTRGAPRFAGYLREPLAAARRDGRGLARPFDADGWFATGDTGVLDADGRLTITGRRDLQFVSGGGERAARGHRARAARRRRRRRGGRGAGAGRRVRRAARRLRPARRRERCRERTRNAPPGARRCRPNRPSRLHGARRVPRVGWHRRYQAGPPGAHARSGAPGGENGLNGRSGHWPNPTRRWPTTGRCGSPRCLRSRGASASTAGADAGACGSGSGRAASSGRQR